MHTREEGTIKDRKMEGIIDVAIQREALNLNMMLV